MNFQSSKMATIVMLAMFSSMTMAGLHNDQLKKPNEFLKYTSKRSKRAWDVNSNPINIFTNKEFETDPSKIKITNFVKDKPWSDSYWPTYKGGIAYRWLDDQSPFDVSLTPVQYKKLTREQIQRLSPAEKFDLLMGRYDVPTFKAEQNRTSPDTAKWEGLCHGWAPASLLFKEPKAVTMTNPDGMKIDFASSDIKALLIFYTANVYDYEDNSQSLFAGNRCNSENGSGCMNTNAGAFHLIITNMINKKIPMVADIDRGVQVWNQPIAGYEILSQTPVAVGRTAAPGTVRSFLVRLKMHYGQEANQSWNGGNNITKQVVYEYTIEIDKNNKIIGGEWISAEKPDFIWTTNEPAFSDPYFGNIKSIYEKSVKKEAPNAVPEEDRNSDETNAPARSFDGISVGDLVVETYQTRSIVKVVEVSEDGKFYVTGGDEGSGGDWYSRGYLLKLVKSYDGISVDDNVVETYQTKSLAKVKYITENGSYFITGGDEGAGGDWYSRSYLKRTVQELNGIKVGDSALEVYQTRSIVKVQVITEDGSYFVTGGDEGTVGDWYGTKYLRKLVSSFNGINVGDIVTEAFQARSQVRVLYISDDGYFYVTGGDEGSGGDWYHRSYILK